MTDTEMSTEQIEAWTKHWTDIGFELTEEQKVLLRDVLTETREIHV